MRILDRPLPDQGRGCLPFAGSDPLDVTTARAALAGLAVLLPAAAFAHSVEQFAYDPGDLTATLAAFPVHVLFGATCGLPILLPAYAAQAGVYAVLRWAGAGWPVQVVAGGLLQAGLVAGWAGAVGLQPSLAGNFYMPPVMMAAAGVVGGLVAGLTTYVLGR